MSRFAILLFPLAVALASSGGAFAQTTPDQTAKQQAAAKHLGCKKAANAKNLTGAERAAFMADCQK